MHDKIFILKIVSDLDLFNRDLYFLEVSWSFFFQAVIINYYGENLWVHAECINYVSEQRKQVPFFCLDNFVHIKIIISKSSSISSPLVPNRVVFLVINQLRVEVTHRYDYNLKTHNVFFPMKTQERYWLVEFKRKIHVCLKKERIIYKRRDFNRTKCDRTIIELCRDSLGSWDHSWYLFCVSKTYSSLSTGKGMDEGPINSAKRRIARPERIRRIRT